MRGLKAGFTSQTKNLYRPTAGDGCALWLPGQDDPQSATIRDRSGQGNNGTLVLPTWAKSQGKLWGLSFDGTDDYVNCGDPTFFDNATTPMSFLMWVRPSSFTATAYQMLIDKWGTAGWSISGYDTTGTVLFGVYKTSLMQARSTSTLTNYVWVHIAITYSGNKAVSGVKIYLNAASDTVISVADDTPGDDISNAINLQLGARNGTNYPFNGLMALVSIHNLVLTPAQILNRFNRERALFGV